MQNELDKYLDRQPELFFCDEFSPLGDRKKRVACKLCKSIFLGKMTQTCNIWRKSN
jgi:hypothetical protein